MAAYQSVKVDKTSLMIYNQRINIFTEQIIKMLRMLHESSGRNNFGVVKDDNNKKSVSSQEQKITPDKANTIQQQTDTAIKTVGETNQEKKEQKL